jgi:hypothetical protein
MRLASRKTVRVSAHSCSVRANYFSSRDVVLDICLLVSIVLAWLVPQFGDGVLGAIEQFGIRLAQRKHLAILVIALVPF